MAEAAYKNWEEEPKKAKLRHLDAMVVDAIMRGTEGVRISEVILAAVVSTRGREVGREEGEQEKLIT